MCGAVPNALSTLSAKVGSSPRVRSGPGVGALGNTAAGIISACAERSTLSAMSCVPPGDHLRVCGAVLLSLEYRVEQLGIISACAERSDFRLGRGVPSRDHLRVCGAVLAQVDAALAQRGSSPRVRSGPAPPARRRPGQRIISACAERSTACESVSWFAGDHLRVCGAVDTLTLELRALPGSSPRVRSGR